MWERASLKQKRVNGCEHLLNVFIFLSCGSHKFSMSKVELIIFPPNLFLFLTSVDVQMARTTLLVKLAQNLSVFLTSSLNSIHNKFHLKENLKIHKNYRKEIESFIMEPFWMVCSVIILVLFLCLSIDFL